MSKIVWFFVFLLALLPTAMGKPELTVSQFYYTENGARGCRYDALLTLPESVSIQDIEGATAELSVREWSYTTHQYEEHTVSSNLSYRETLHGATASFLFTLEGSCYLSSYDATLSLQAAGQLFTAQPLDPSSRPYCGSSLCNSDELWKKKEADALAAESYRREEAERDEKNKDIYDAGERYAARFKGEVALRHPALLGLKTADTLGKLGVRYEPVGFLTLGVTERFDLGLGVRSYRAGEEKLFFPGAEAKLKLVKEGALLPAISISASGNTLTKDRTLAQGTAGLRLGASALGSFSEEAQHVGDTQFTVGLHGSKELGVLEAVAGKPHLRLHTGALYTQTRATKGTSFGAQSYTGDDVVLQAGVDVTEWHNVFAFLAEGNYSLASGRTDVSAGFRISLAGAAADLGVGFTGAESLIIDGAQIELPARFYPRIGFSFLF